MNNSSFAIFAAAPFFPPERAFWLYFTGFLILIAGLVAIRTEAGQAQGTDKFIVFSRLFLALSMGVFGADHFIAAKNIAGLVPSWIPGHLFWAYFVGVALVAAAFSIAVKRYAVLAASLLAGMIFSFVLLIHIPNLVTYPRDRYALVVLLRDLSFSAGALAFAVAHAKRPGKAGASKITVLIRLVIAIAAVVFGVEHFLYPQFVPVVPLRQLMPSWIPAHAAIAYVTGLVLAAAGLSLIVNWKSRLAATWLGIFVFVIVVLVYLPITVAKPSDIGDGLNYLVDTLAFSASALLLAGALPKEDGAEHNHRNAEGAAFAGRDRQGG